MRPYMLLHIFDVFSVESRNNKEKPLNEEACPHLSGSIVDWEIKVVHPNSALLRSHWFRVKRGTINITAAQRSPVWIHQVPMVPEISAVTDGMAWSSRGSSSRAAMFLLRADMLPRALHAFTAADFFTTYKNINSLKACILKIYPNNHICYIRHILFFSKMCQRCFKKSFTLFFMFWLNIFNRTIKKGGQHMPPWWITTWAFHFPYGICSTCPPQQHNPIACTNTEHNLQNAGDECTLWAE